MKGSRYRGPKYIDPKYESGRLINVAGLDLSVDQPHGSYLILDFETQPFIWQSPARLADHVLLELEKSQ